MNPMNRVKRFEDTSPQDGFTLLEIVIAIGILLVVVASLVAVFLVASSRAAENNGNVLLSVVAGNLVARLRAEEFVTLTADFQTTFHCTENGSISFVDPGDAPVSGTLEFFDDENNIPGSFGELSGTFDLNANGTIDASPVSDYKVLPTRIHLTLNDPNDSRTATIDLVLRRR